MNKILQYYTVPVGCTAIFTISSSSSSGSDINDDRGGNRKNKKIISYGATNINGRPHAETIALNKIKRNSNEHKKKTIWLKYWKVQPYLKIV